MMPDVFLPAFASPILQRIHALDKVAEMNQKIAASIRTLEAGHQSDDFKRAHQGGFYTKGNLLELDMPGFAELKTYVEAMAHAYIRATREQDMSTMPIAQDDFNMWSWAAITREKDYQTPHVHAGSSISIVYYVETPTDKPSPQGCLDLLTPLDIKEMTFLKGASSTYCRIDPKPGVMVAFPAYMKHYFHPFYGPEERVMVATNIDVKSHVKRPGQ